MAVDVVNSTDVLALGGKTTSAKVPNGPERLNIAISRMCRVIQSKRGSVYSFTGDGMVAIFEKRHFQNETECAFSALQAADQLFDAMREGLAELDQWRDREKKHLALRIALHWGEAVIPSGGPLRHQVLGADVIITCRLMNAVDQRDQDGKPVKASHRVNQAITATFKARLPDADRTWNDFPEEDFETLFKGVDWVEIRGRVDKVHVARDDAFQS